MATSVNRRVLELTAEERSELDRISVSRTLSASRIMRARLMLAFAKGEPVSAIASSLNISESTVHVTVARVSGSRRACGAQGSAETRSTKHHNARGLRVVGQSGMPEAKRYWLSPRTLDARFA